MRARAAAQVANIALNNMSLVFISLSLSQIIRSGIPVMTALLGVVIEKKVPTPFELLSLVVLTAGVVLSVRALTQMVWESDIQAWIELLNQVVLTADRRGALRRGPCMARPSSIFSPLPPVGYCLSSEQAPRFDKVFSCT